LTGNETLASLCDAKDDGHVVFSIVARYSVQYVCVCVQRSCLWPSFYVMLPQNTT